MNVLTKNIHRIPIIKPEHHPVLIIDTDAPVTRPVVFELFKVVSWTLKSLRLIAAFSISSLRLTMVQRRLSIFRTLFGLAP